MLLCTRSSGGLFWHRNTAATAATRPGSGGQEAGTGSGVPGPLGAERHAHLHWDPVSLRGMKDGAFISLHGSWNRAPRAPQGGYNVVFQPLEERHGVRSLLLSSRMVSQANSWNWGRAAHRPTGLRGGTGWRPLHRRRPRRTDLALSPTAATRRRRSPAAPPVRVSAATGTSASPPEGIHPNAWALPPLPIPRRFA